jgi:alanine dehydrogenase
MKIGVAKEIKKDEYRVALTTAGVRELVHHGHEVTVETSAGTGSSMSDDDYRAAGASSGSASRRRRCSSRISTSPPRPS